MNILWISFLVPILALTHFASGPKAHQDVGDSGNHHYWAISMPPTRWYPFSCYGSKFSVP